MGLALTPPQRRLLDTIRWCTARGEPMPTYRELCAEFGWRSTGTARDHLRALARKGAIDLPARRARGVRLRGDRPSAVAVPLVGQVVAGTPVAADQAIEGTVAVPASWTAHGTCFALRVFGDSMTGAGILDGDQVVVRQADAASDGDIVVATVNGETTVKRFRRHGRRVALEPQNPRFRAIDLDTQDVVLHGVVVGVLRSYVSAEAAARPRRAVPRGRGNRDADRT